MDFKSIEELNAYLQKQIDEVLKNEVAKAVKDQIHIGVVDEVYNVKRPDGTPKKYERRGVADGSGGLADRERMIVRPRGVGRISITDEADFNPTNGTYGDIDRGKSLGENIEKGYGDRQKWYNKGRPFMEHARENLISGKYHIEAMKKGLKEKGIDAKVV